MTEWRRCRYLQGGDQLATPVTVTVAGLVWQVDESSPSLNSQSCGIHSFEEGVNTCVCRFLDRHRGQHCKLPTAI